MAASNPTFMSVWQNEDIRKAILSNVDKDTLCALRLTASDCRLLTTATLFKRTRLTLTPSALSRPSRLEALSRIGHHIQHLTFSMPHTDSTFLPPLLNPFSGREVTFLYTPHTSLASESQRPKYGTQELGDVLTQQYPPIFHAASNVPAFIRAMACMPNLRHLSVSCPGQDPAQRYRRSAVDYALISLRIAIERAHLVRLTKLSINMHPSGLLYFRHQPGFGSSPAAGRRWKQIRKLKLTVDAWDFQGTRPGLDHLKIIDDYIRNFSANLEKVSFTWNGRKGPCPFTLSNDAVFAPPRDKKKLFAEVTSPMSPLPAAPPRPSMRFPKVRNMQVCNAHMSSSQVSDLIVAHRHAVREFDFDNVNLISGTWEEALDPLERMSGSDSWQSQRSGSGSESMESFASCQTRPSLEQLTDKDITDTHSHGGAEGALDDCSSPMGQMTKLRKRRVRRRRRVKPERGHDAPARPYISAPFISSPGPFISAPILSSSPVLSTSPILQPTVFDPTIQGVQRNLALEASQQALTDEVAEADGERRVSTLRKAREAVLARLGNQFCKQPPYSNANVSREQLKGLFTRPGRFKAGNVGQAPVASRTQLVPLMIFR